MDRLELLDELRTIGQNGLRYADDPYDEARYERLLEVVAEAYDEALDLPAAEVRSRLADEFGHVTPKVGAAAGIFDADGEILLMRRADTNEWCLPCGWVEPGEDPEETAVRETREETGLDVVARSLIDVYYGPPGERYDPHGRVSVNYLCEIEAGSLTLSHEGEQLAYRDVDEVAEWHPQHETFARDAKRAWLRAHS